jgi:alpha-ribazole phosphatase
MARLLLLRHARSGTDGIYYGLSDVSVTAEGRAQEDALESLLDGHSFLRVVTSPLKRCRELAGRLARTAGAPLEINEEFLEINLGDWEGRSFDEASNIYREIATQLFDYDPELAFPGGESLNGFRARVGAAFDAFASPAGGEEGDILAVLHAGVIRAVLAHLRRSDAREFWQPDIPNGSMTVIRVEAAGNSVMLPRGSR